MSRDCGERVGRCARVRCEAGREISGRHKGVGQTVYLSLEKRGGALVPQDKVGQLDFSRQRQLLGDSLPGERTRQTALLQSGELLGRSTGDAYREIKPILQTLFEEQGHLDCPIRIRFRRKRRPPRRKHPGMRELLEPQPVCIVGKDPAAERRPIDGAVGGDDARTEPLA